MDKLSEIIGILDKSDKIAFLKELKAKNKRKDVKNIDLFKIVETDDLNSIKKIYPNAKNRDAYHALRKRLSENLVEFLSNRIFEKNAEEIHESLRYLVVARYFNQYQFFQLAHRFLKKAEKQALKLEQYSLLHEIYQTQLENHGIVGTENFEEIQYKIQQNIQQIAFESQLKLAYHFVRIQINEMHLNKKIIDFEALIIESLEKFNLDLRQIMSYRSLSQMLFIANEFAHIQQDFKRVEPFVKKTLRFLESKQENKDLHLEEHLQILYFLANYTFRTHQFENSLGYLAEMENSWKTKKQNLSSKFIGKWMLLTSLNYLFTGKAEKSIEQIDHLLKTQSKLAFEEVYDLKMTKILCMAFLGSPNLRKELHQFNHSDAFFEKKLGMLWTIRKNLLEILVYEQEEETELALSRIKSFQRRYKNYLLEVKEARVLTFLKFIEEILLNPDKLALKSFQNKIDHFIQNETQKDPFVQCFYVYLESKIRKESAYTLLLKTANKKS